MSERFFKMLTSLLRIAWLLLAILVTAALSLPLQPTPVRSFIVFAMPLTLLGAVGILWKNRV